MISVKKALDIIKESKREFGSEEIALENSVGQVLAEDWKADRYFPPYDRVTMDGIAILYDQFENGQRKFPIEAIVAAGSPQAELKNSINCLEVMTGAVMPRGVDTVIRYEDISTQDGVASILVDQLRSGQNVHGQGTDKQSGEILVLSGIVISAAEIGIAASIGKHRVQVYRAPKTLVVSTGDELVDIHETPLAHQIRKSNVHRISTTLNEWKIPVDMAHLTDSKESIRRDLTKAILEYELIIMSGGVSKGKFDFLPEVLEELGVTKKFHRLAQRPGKPLWFGQKDQCTLFGLPGNPNSSFLCTHKYVRYWLDHSMGMENRKEAFAVLTENVEFRPELRFFLQVKLESSMDGQLLAHPKRGNGSGDFSNLSQADAFMELPESKSVFSAGEVYPILAFRS